MKPNMDDGDHTTPSRYSARRASCHWVCRHAHSRPGRTQVVVDSVPVVVYSQRAVGYSEISNRIFFTTLGFLETSDSALSKKEPAYRQMRHVFPNFNEAPRRG